MAISNAKLQTTNDVQPPPVGPADSRRSGWMAIVQRWWRRGRWIENQSKRRGGLGVKIALKVQSAFTHLNPPFPFRRPIFIRGRTNHWALYTLLWPCNAGLLRDTLTAGDGVWGGVVWIVGSVAAHLNTRHFTWKRPCFDGAAPLQWSDALHVVVMHSIGFENRHNRFDWWETRAPDAKSSHDWVWSEDGGQIKTTYRRSGGGGDGCLDGKMWQRFGMWDGLGCVVEHHLGRKRTFWCLFFFYYYNISNLSRLV